MFSCDISTDFKNSYQVKFYGFQTQSRFVWYGLNFEFDIELYLTQPGYYTSTSKSAESRLNVEYLSVRVIELLWKLPLLKL